MSHHALSGAHIPFVKIQSGSGKSGKDLLLAHGPFLNVVEPTVIALADHWVDRTEFKAFTLTTGYHIIHQSVMDQAHIERIGEGDGCFQSTQFLHLDQAQAFSKAVEHESGGG